MKYALIIILSILTGCATITTVPTTPIAIGFDVDDTVLFSSPSFEVPTTVSKAAFWDYVNSHSSLSTPIHNTVRIIKQHLALGHTVYLITKRPHTANEDLTAYINNILPTCPVLFCPKGKTIVIKTLQIKLFYGDSDSDITDALDAGAIPVRVPRPPLSNYKSSNNPGKYNEYILPN